MMKNPEEMDLKPDTSPEANASTSSFAQQPPMNRKARLIVRNLPFKSRDADLMQYFRAFGDVQEMKVLKHPDGRMVGCCFLQYKETQSAAKAIVGITGKPLNGRVLVADWAVAKDRYVERMAQGQGAPLTPKVEAVVEPPQVKQEEEKVEEKPVLNPPGEEPKPKMSRKQRKRELAAADKVVKRPRFESHDVSEGKTVFIRNVPFTATNDDVRECMQQFGPVDYAIVCIDKLTEHSKGTAFVKFKNQADADNCVGRNAQIFGKYLAVLKAVSRQDLQSMKPVKEEIKDSRNLYLAKEGVVMAGSRAAEGVSAADMAKRLQIEQLKSQMLKKLNMFVARDRLVVHNIPPAYSDARLKEVLDKHLAARSNNSGLVKAHIMRDNRHFDGRGQGVSKGYAFLAFQTHEAALAALRTLNNNPNVFSAKNRPIVTFSIENRQILNLRQKRLEKSRQKNPQCKEYKKPEEDKKQVRPKTSAAADADGVAAQTFAGVTARKGVTKLRSKFNLKTQARIHKETLKRQKLQMKKKRKTEPIKQPKQKGGSKAANKLQTDNFTKLVNEYKSKLVKVGSAKCKKWYDQ